MYGRAVCEETCSDALPGFKSKLRWLVETSLAAGLVFEFYRRSRMDIASDLALKTAITIICGLGAFLLLHFGWSWATAPRRLFYRQRQEVDQLKTQLAEIIGKRMTPVDALERVERLVKLSEELPLDEWYATAIADLSDCFIPFVANGFQVAYDNLTKRGVRRAAVRQQLLDRIHVQVSLLRRGENGSLTTKYLGP